MESVNEIKQSNIDDNVYCKWIKKTGELIIAQVNEIECGKYQKDNFCFGLAAKLISIYIKTVEVLPTKGMSNLSAIAYPPLDSYVLNNIKAEYPTKMKTTWSKFDWKDYLDWINFLRTIKGDRPWWKLEEYWYDPKSSDTGADLQLRIRSVGVSVPMNND